MEGTGATPLLTDYVNIKFKGYLLNETLVSDSRDSAIEFKLNELIVGWKIGFQKFKAGSKGTLLIPSAYGYGSRAQGTIPANSVLVFDVELVSFR